MQVLRIDLRILSDKLLHLRGNSAFDLQLLHVADLPRDWVLSEEVTRQHLLDVAFLPKARSRLRFLTSGAHVAIVLALPETKRLNGVH